MLSKRFSNILLIVLFCVIVASCNNNTVYEHRHNFENNTWERVEQGKTISFDGITIEDTSCLYDIYLSLRHTPYINENPIEIVMNINSEGGIERQSVHKIELMDRYKKQWTGKAMGDMIDVEQKIRSFVQFPQKGKYSISITNKGKYKQMYGIMDMAIKIKKADVNSYKNVK